MRRPEAIRQRKANAGDIDLKYITRNGDIYDEKFKRTLFARMTSQNWPGICDVNFDRMGRGVVSTQKIEKDSIVVDYCGKVIKGVTADEYVAANKDYVKEEYLFQLSAKHLIDASFEPCPNHPNIRCVGRLLNHRNPKKANITPKLLSFGDNNFLVLVAQRNIPPFEQLQFDYGDEEARKLFND